MVESYSDEKVQAQILKHLAEQGEIKDTLTFAKELDIPHTELDKSLKSLLVDDYLVLTVLEKKLVELSDEGASYADKGTPEYQYASAMELNKQTDKAEVDAKVGAEIAKIGFSKAMQRKWVQLDPKNKNIVTRVAEKLEDTERD